MSKSRQTGNLVSNNSIFVNSNGDVGIGTDNIPLKLTVVGNVRAGYDPNIGVTLGLTPVGIPTNDTNSYILWGNDATFGGINGDLIYVPRTSAGASHRFYAGSPTPSEIVRIKSNGVVQVGDAALGSDNGDRRLDIIGSGDAQSGLLIANNAVSASGTCDVTFAPSNKVAGAQIICHALEDFSSAANRTADLAFTTRKDGTLSEKVRVLANGGLTFNGDTAAANALDDYEEGTWTPGQGNLTTWTSPTFTATYTKIGRLVQVNLRQTGGTIGWSATQFMTGLPYTPAEAGSAYATDTGPSSDNGALLIWTNSTVYFQAANASEAALVFSATYYTS